MCKCVFDVCGIDYKGLLRAAAADANGARLLQQVEVFFLELETFHTAFQADHGRQLWPEVIHIQNCHHLTENTRHSQPVKLQEMVSYGVV